MIIQKIDNKGDCNLFVSDSGQIFEAENLEYSGTWSYFDDVSDKATIAQLLIQAKTIDKACPPHLKEDLDRVNRKMDRVKKALVTAKVDCNTNCLYEIIPEHILIDYYQVKNTITKHIIENNQKTSIYDHLLGASKLVSDIKKNNIKLDMKKLKRSLGPSKINRFFRKIKKLTMRIDYDIFGTKTGRLTCKKKTFPILNLDRELRKFVVPNNDLFLEIDVNGAELRALLFLLDREQPDLDIHDWNCRNVFNNSITRDEAKKRVFAWLYNQESSDHLLNKEYDRDSIKSKFYDGEKITTPYGRVIECDEFHAVNYILQSFSNDILLEQAQKINLTLKDKNSNIAFMMHDSLILDYSSEDISVAKSIIKMFEETRFGKTRVNVKMGKNLLDMKEVSWKK